MARIVQVVGAERVIANLKKRRARMAAGVSRGLRLAGLHLQAESQKQVPVDTGNLKASAFTRGIGAGYQTKVIVGYTADYALYVHEAKMVLQGKPRPNDGVGGKPSLYWDPQGRAKSKFLEDPARSERRKMRRIIKTAILIS